MHTIVYVYRVAPDRVDDFLEIQRAAARIYVEHGALDDETLGAVDLSPRYGCRGFADAFGAGDDAVLIGLARFRDRAHHDEVMERVNRDARIDALFEQVGAVLDLGEVALGEFRRVV